MAIPVVLIDDHTLVRQAVVRMLDAHPDIDVVAEAGSLADGYRVLEETGISGGERPGSVVVVDVTMGDGSGLSLVRTLRVATKAVGIVVLTMHDDDATLMEALDSGASALVRKSEPVDEVVSAVLRAASSPLAFTATGLAEALRRGAQARPATTLTPREQEVLQLLAEGSSVAQVGKTLFMSSSTVKTHIGKIYEKLGAHNRASAVMAAVRLGLITSPPD